MSHSETCGTRLVVEVERFQDLAGNPAMGAGDSLVFQVARAQAGGEGVVQCQGQIRESS